MSTLKTIITLLLVASGILEIQYLVRPEWDLVNRRRADLATVQQTLDQTKDLGRRYDELDARYQQISPDDIARITDFLPPKPDIGDLLIDVDTLVANAGLKLDSISFDEGAGKVNAVSASAPPATEANAAGDLIESFGFSFKTSGSYEAFQKLLTSLENNLRLVDITKVTFGMGSDDSDHYQFSVEAKTYYQKKNVF